jgi:AcrR family transcriptional regulator
LRAVSDRFESQHDLPHLLEDLMAFVAVVEAGGFNAAGRRFGVPPSRCDESHQAQAGENWAHILATASALFRERGYDGVGVSEPMATAGCTHGGFYEHFGSKADLMAETAATSICAQSQNSAGADLTDFFKSCVSRAHRDARDAGCTVAALCGDAARQSEGLKATFLAPASTSHESRPGLTLLTLATAASTSPSGSKAHDECRLVGHCEAITSLRRLGFAAGSGPSTSRRAASAARLNVRQTSVCSEISSASWTSTPR